MITLANFNDYTWNDFSGQVVIDRDYYNTKEEQFKQVFSDMDFLGWYSIGDRPTAPQTRKSAYTGKQIKQIISNNFCT